MQSVWKFRAYTFSVLKSSPLNSIQSETNLRHLKKSFQIMIVSRPGDDDCLVFCLPRCLEDVMKQLFILVVVNTTKNGLNLKGGRPAFIMIPLTQYLIDGVGYRCLVQQDVLRPIVSWNLLFYDFCNCFVKIRFSSLNEHCTYRSPIESGWIESLHRVPCNRESTCLFPLVSAAELNSVYVKSWHSSKIISSNHGWLGWNESFNFRICQILLPRCPYRTSPFW